MGTTAARRLKGIVGALALAATSTCATAFVIELGLRALWPGENQYATATLDIYAPDPVVGYRLRPNIERIVPWVGREILVLTDESGHRIPGRRLRPEGHGQLVAAGDSYVFGNEVQAEETFVWLLGEEMRVRPVNLGVGGYTLGHSVRRLTQYLRLPSAGPVREALLVIYAGNDLDPHPPEISVDSRGYLVTEGGEAGRTGGAKRTLLLNSRLAFMAYKVLLRQRYRARVWRGEDTVVAPEDPGTIVQSLEEPLFDLRSAAAEAGCRLTVAIVPYQGQVYGHGGAWENGELAELLRKEGIPVMDLLPAMKKQKEKGGPRLFHDVPEGHLSPDGHRFVATALAAWWRQP